MKTTLTRRGFVAGTVSAGLMSSSGWAQSPTNIDIGTMSTGSPWYQYGVLFSQYMKSALPAGTVVNVRPYAAALGNLKLIQENSRIQMGLTFSTNIAWALKGMTDIQKISATNVRAIAGRISQYYVGIMALSSSGMTSLSDALAGKKPLRIVATQPGSLGALSVLLELKANGVDEKTLKSWGGSVNFISLQACADSVANGRADIWINMIAVGHPQVQELAYSHDIRFLTLSKASMDKMQDLGYVPAELPANSFKGQTQPVLMAGTGTVLIVNKDMSDDTAYKITKSILSNLNEIKKQNASLKAFDPKVAWTPKATGGAKLHPGAERAYRELGFMS